MAFRFEYQGRKYMQADDGVGYRISQDAHSGRELYIEDTALVTKRLKAYQDKLLATLAAGIDSIEAVAECGWGYWSEDMEWDAFIAQDDERLEWLAELAAQDDERQGLQWGE